MGNKRSKAEPSEELQRLALFKLVKSSSFLSQREKDVWGALFQYGPLTGQEIDQKIGAVGCASSRLIELERRNMTVRLGRRRCSVSGRTAALWGITLNQPTALVRVRKVSHSPTNGELKAFVGVVRIALLGANRRGMRISSEAKRVLKWLEDGAPCVHDKVVNQHQARNKKSNRA